MSGATVVISPAGYSVASGFYTDQFASYATRLVDPSITSDVAGGTTLTRTWNGSSASYQVYKTLQYAVNDWLTQGGRRVGLLNATTYTLSADLAFPSATSLSDSARVVLMGDPSSTETNMARIDLSSAFRVVPTKNGTRDYVTLRKVWFDGNVTTAVETGWVGFGDFGDTTASYNALVVEFCKFSNIRQPDNAKNIGAIKFGQSTGTPPATGPVVRNNKFLSCYAADINNSNTVAIMLEVSGNTVGPGKLDINRNEFSGCATAFFSKVTNGTGADFYRNVTHDGGRFLVLGNAGASVTDSGTIAVYLNLVYGMSAGAYAVDSALFSPGQGQGLWVYQNTIAEDVVGGLALTSFNDCRAHSNAILTSGGGGIVKLKYRTGYSGTTIWTQVDRNAYYADANWTLGATNYSSLSSWRAATGTPLAGGLNQDANSFFISSLSTEFTNVAGRDYSLTPGSALRGAGVGGVNIGYDWTDCGPGW